MRPRAAFRPLETRTKTRARAGRPVVQIVRQLAALFALQKPTVALNGTVSRLEQGAGGDSRLTVSITHNRPD